MSIRPVERGDASASRRHGNQGAQRLAMKRLSLGACARVVGTVHAFDHPADCARRRSRARMDRDRPLERDTMKRERRITFTTFATLATAVVMSAAEQPPPPTTKKAGSAPGHTHRGAKIQCVPGS